MQPSIMSLTGWILGIAVAATLLTGTLAVAADNQRVLRHVVAFKFKESATPDEVRKVEEAFAALPARIREIKGFEWGLNNSPEGLNKGCTHGFILTFASEADRDAYLVHPEHKKFGGLVGPLLADVFVVDFWAQGAP